MLKKVSAPPKIPFFPRSVLWLLLAVTLLGGLFRFYKPNWDYQHSFHPDERNILGQTAGIQPATGYRVSFFAYGQLPVYLYRSTGELISTPAVFQQIFHNETLALGVYWAFLLGILALVGASFFRGRWILSNYTFLSFLFANFAFWSAFPIVSGQGVSASNFLFWFLLLGVLLFLYWVLRDEGHEILEYATAGVLFLLYLIFRFFPLFYIWAKTLNDWPARITCFALVTVVALGASWLAARLLEMEWLETPFYSAVGTVFFFGVAPFFLPGAFAQLLAAAFFTVLAFGCLLVFSLVSRWGRVLTALLAFWTLFASLDHLGRQFTGYGECMILGRLWAAAFSTATIPGVFLLVQRIYRNTGMALLAASFFAFAVVSIEQTHYCITESFITFLLVVVALASSEIIREGNWRSYLLAGGAFGLSMAAKTSSLYYLFLLMTAHLISLSQRTRKDWEKEDKKLVENREIYTVLAIALLGATVVVFAGVGWKFRGVFADLFWMNPVLGKGLWLTFFAILTGLGFVFSAWGVLEFRILRAQMGQWIKLAAAGGLSFLLFVLFSPWSLLDLQGFMNSQNYEWHVVSIADACYVLQFKDTPRYLYHLWNLMSVELWWPLGVTVVAGMAWVLVRFLWNLARPVEKGSLLPVPFSKSLGFSFSMPDLLLLSWFIPYFGFIGSWNTKFIRYMVPLIPFFCIFGARLLTDIFQWTQKTALDRFLKPALIALVMGPSLFYSIAYMHVYSAPNPWIDASVWIFKNIPAGSMILTEAWDDGLPTSVDPQQDSRMKTFMGPGSYRQEGMTVYELHGFPTDDSPIKKNYYADVLQRGDYISIASKKLWYTLTDETPEFRPKGFNAYPVSSRYYRCLWSGLLGYKMVAEFHNFPGLFGWEHPDDMAEESFSVYDHPHVYIFKKVETVSRERILKLLESDDYVKGIDREMMRTMTPGPKLEAFIAERRKYLEDKGLWKQLEEAAPVAPVTVTSPNAKPTPAKPSSPSKPAARSKPAVETPVPTPEVKVNAPSTVPGVPTAATLGALQELADHPVIEQDVANRAALPEESGLYQWRAWLTWLLALVVLGWLALPVTLRLLAPFPNGAYSLSKVMGFFLFVWVVWFPTSLKVCRFTLGACWTWFLLLAAGSAFLYWKDRVSIKALFAKWGRTWMIQEGAFVLAFLAFTLVKVFIPHIHDPVGDSYHGGGEAGMDFGFLASTVRGESFPPQNMWMAGLPISYSFYYGHLMMGVLTKFLGLVPAVTYNLGLITLFALVFSCAFGLAYALSGRLVSGWVAGFLCAAAGNPAGTWQLMDALRQGFFSGLGDRMFNYDDFGPTRVIPNSINEFPYFSVLYGDMHAHTLAMPFAMLFLAVALSLYLRRPSAGDWPLLAVLGFLMGGISYLNTWELPAWLLLTVMFLLVRGIVPMNPKGPLSGLGIFLGTLAFGLSLLGALTSLGSGFDAQVLGGKTGLLMVTVAVVVGVTWVLCFAQGSTRAFALLAFRSGIGLGVVLVSMLLLWSPYFFKLFRPQQSEILWVPPSLRTNLHDFFGIFGLFAIVLMFSALVVLFRPLTNWMMKEKKSRWMGLEASIEKILAVVEGFLQTNGAVSGMLFLGIASLALIWGASWVHWASVVGKSFGSLALGLVTALLLALALGLRKVMALWVALLAWALIWSALLVGGIIPLYQESSVFLNLLLFAVLWLLAFFHLGLALQAGRDRPLSAAYLLVSFFFFILATVEVFVMREYMGGEWLRNNTLFKFYIVAWELASIAVGIFLPRILELFETLPLAARRESTLARRTFVAVSILLGFLLIKAVLGTFLASLGPATASCIDLLLLGVIWGWVFMEGWIEGFLTRVLFAAWGGFLLLAVVVPMLPPAPYTSTFYQAQRWLTDLSKEVLLPLGLAALLNGILLAVWEGRRDLGRVLVALNWKVLLTAFGCSVLVYPVFATFRKCHDFVPAMRQRWTGSVEPLTLNGLEYIAKVNPYDAAAIRFLNQRVPDQPCLAEFVGEGYNSWGSRFSIFTGIPALMGWDGHVREWVTGRPDLGEDVGQRFQATEQIFRTTDPVLAKKYLDAYGVRLVMVGTVERNGVPGRKGGYPTEGLSKFSGFLPLIYRNPQVEIYYNPPAKN